MMEHSCENCIKLIREYVSCGDYEDSCVLGEKAFIECQISGSEDYFEEVAK